MSAGLFQIAFWMFGFALIVFFGRVGQRNGRKGFTDFDVRAFKTNDMPGVFGFGYRMRLLFGHMTSLAYYASFYLAEIDCSSGS